MNSPAPGCSHDSVAAKTEPEDETDSPCSKKPHLDNNEEQASAMKYLLGDYYEISDDSVTNEVDEYFNEKPSQMCPLEFWKLNNHRFPYLSQIARKILCIPATSTASERVFSAAGNTVIAKRASLDRDTVDELVFLNSALNAKGKDKVRNLVPVEGNHVQSNQRLPKSN